MLGSVLKGMNHILSHPFFLPTGWKGDQRDGVSAAIWDHEVGLQMETA